MHQRKIHHRHLIYYDHICFQWVIPVPAEAVFLFFILRVTADFQQTVYRLCFISGCLRHTLCCSSGRCCQQNIRSVTFKIMDHGIDCRCLTGSRSSGQHKYSMTYRLNNRFPLFLIQRQIHIFLNLCQSVQYSCLTHIIGYI